MCKIDPTVKKWFDTVNNMGQNIAYHARHEYDTFLEKCLEPYGVDKINAALNADRVRIEEENLHIEGFEKVSYQRFYIDGKYAFTIVMTQAFETTNNECCTRCRTTYDKVVEQDRLSKEINMTNKEAAEILETVRGMSARKEEDEASNMAISALEEQDKYQWIFACVNDPKWDSFFEKVEKALGFKLFYWQKTYILKDCYRRSGGTTAMVLKRLLDTEAEPIDFSRPTRNKKFDFFRKDLLRIKEKLDKAGIKTREVWRCKAEKDEWYKERSTENIQTSIDSTISQNRSRNYSGLFDTEN